MSVRLWELEEYWGTETQLPGLIDLDWIHGHLARTIVSVGPDRVKVWATIDLAKESLSYFHPYITD